MFTLDNQKVFFRGEFIPFKDANVSIANSTLLYGMGIFTGMRAHYNEEEGQLYIFRAKEHFARFNNACKMCQMKGFTENYDQEKFLGVIKELLKINEIKQDAYIRVSQIYDENQIGPKFGYYKDTLAIFLYPLGDYVPTGGMKCKISSWTRVEDNAIPARLKVNGAYVNTALAKTEALQAGFDEALVMDSRGHVVEGSAENLFMVRDGKLITPPKSDNILEGITRGTVLEIAKDEGYTIEERSIDRTELYFADEVFLTGTGAKVSPVTLIDNVTIGDGNPGPISKHIQSIYFDAVRGKVEKYKGWVSGVY